QTNQGDLHIDLSDNTQGLIFNLSLNIFQFCRHLMETELLRRHLTTQKCQMTNGKCLGLAGDVSDPTSPVLTICQESRDLPDNSNPGGESLRRWGSPPG